MKHAILISALLISHLIAVGQIIDPSDDLKPIPVFDGEAASDDQGVGWACTETDIVPDGQGDGAFLFVDGSSNLVIRIRLADAPTTGAPFFGTRSSFSLLIDSDQLIGDDDPNSNSVNPGFEFAITRASNSNVYLYDIDGASDCGSTIGSAYTSNQETSTSSSVVSCGGTDYLLDFYIPLADLPGVALDSGLRFSVVSSQISGFFPTADCPFDDGTPFDIYGSTEAGFAAIVENVGDQCFTAFDDLCDSCDGFLDGRTDIPTLNSVFVGNTALSGQIAGSPQVFIDVFDGTNTLREQDTITASGGFWNSNDLDTPLADGDSVIVFALATGQCISLVDESGATNYGVVSADPIPQISDNSSAITWAEDEGEKSLYSAIDISDNGTTLASAQLFFSSGYDKEEDTLRITGSTAGFTVSWDDDLGEYDISGTQDIEDYEELLSNVTYLNTIDTVEASVKKVTLRVNDGTNQSFPFVKDVIINIVNDAPYFIDSLTNEAVDTLRLELVENTSLEIKLTVADEEGNAYSISYGNLVNGNGTISQDEMEQEKITFTPTTDFIGNDFFNVSACDLGDPDNCTTTAIVLTVNESNPAPTVFDPNLAISYTEGDDPKNLYQSLLISDDGTTLVGATVTFTSNFLANQDTFLITGDLTGVTTSFDDVGGQLSISGTKTIDEYITLLSSIQYSNNGDTLVASNRKVTLKVNDGTKNSKDFTTDIVVNALNDAPYFIDNDANRIDTLRLFLTQDIPLSFCTQVTDQEGNPYTISAGSLINDNGSVAQDEDDPKCLTFNPAPGYIGNDFFILSACDSAETSNCSNLSVILQIVEPNLPADIDAPIRNGDTLQFSVYPNDDLSICLDYEDSNGDNTFLTNVTKVSGTDNFSATLNDTTICISYEANAITGIDLYQIELCDDGLPDPVCKNYWFEIHTVDINSAPKFMKDGVNTDTAFYKVIENATLTDTIILMDDQNDGFVLGDFGQMVPTLDGNLLIVNVPTPELYFGRYLADVTVCDTNDSIQCNMLIVDLDILPVNDPPVANTLELSVENAEPVIINPIANDVDPEGEGLALDTGFILLIEHGKVEYLTDSTIQYTPDRYYDGSDKITYTLCDKGTPQECVQGQILIDINIPTEELVTYDAFSPNGDLINDQWIIDGIGEYPNNVVRIFDQFNRLVFTARGYNNSEVVWEGQDDSGNTLPEGTYYYILNTNGGPDQSGTVILKR